MTDKGNNSMHYLKEIINKKEVDPWGPEKFYRVVNSDKASQGIKYNLLENMLQKAIPGFTKRKLTYYIEKGLIKPPEKTNINQALYDQRHYVYMLFIDSMTKYLPLESVKNFINFVSEQDNWLNPKKVLNIACIISEILSENDIWFYKSIHDVMHQIMGTDEYNELLNFSDDPDDDEINNRRRFAEVMCFKLICFLKGTILFNYHE